MSLPALQQLSSHYPEGSISVLARSSVAGIYERETWASEVIPLTAGRGRGDWAGKWRAARELRRRRFDIAILLQNAFEVALLVWLARIPERIPPTGNRHRDRSITGIGRGEAGIPAPQDRIGHLADGRSD
jgi:heptosyltransferase II